MKNGNGKVDPETHAFSQEVIRIGNNAIQKVREENRRLGLPSVSGRNGKLIFEMPDGSIVVKETAPTK